MSLIQGAGYMQVTSQNGDVIMDTRDDLFHVLTTLSGVVSIPSLRWRSSAAPNSRVSSYSLGAVDGSCTALLGFCQITYATGFSLLPNGAWFPIGGSLVPMMKRFESISGTNGKYISSMQVLTFELSGASVVLKESTVLSDDFYAGPASEMAAQTITYRIFAGTFT